MELECRVNVLNEKYLTEAKHVLFLERELDNVRCRKK